MGQNVASVGHDLQSHTAYVQHFTFIHPDFPNRRIVVLDTPGFDDTEVDDREILRRIAVWLARSYDANMKLAGVIYLHEITQPRMLGTTRKNLDMFTKLCGQDAIKNVILVTTKWSEVMPDIGKRRALQLRNEHWKFMTDLGSRIVSFDARQRTARRIANLILAQEAIDTFQIQHELVQINSILAETEAGRRLRYTLEELLKIQKSTASWLKLEERDDDLDDKMAENEEKIRATLRQIKELNIPLSRKVMRFLGLV